MRTLPNTRTQWLLGALALVGVASASSTASAQEKKQRGVITLAEVHITGRIQKPIAAIDVGRLQPKLTLGELRQPFIDRIEQAVSKEPF